jgi:hypothetical protein
MSSSVSRSYSDKFVPGSSDYDLYKNKNVDFMSNGPIPKIFYALIVLVFWFSLHISRAFSPEDCWTVVNITHGVVSWLTGVRLFVFVSFPLTQPILLPIRLYP